MRPPLSEEDGLADRCERILRDLVRINSVNPYVSGGAGEREIAEHVGTKLRSLGLRVKMQEVIDGRANVIGVLQASGGGGRRLMLNGHLDTVGVEGMVGDPFRPRIDSNRNLHGRGACDMKGSLAAMIAAIEWTVKKQILLLGDIIFTGVVDEEYRGSGTVKVAESLRADAAIVGEPTSLDIAIAHKGFVWLKVVTHGRAAHGSVPEKGVDAIENMGDVILGLKKLRKKHRVIRHPLLGTPKIHTSTISGGTEWAVIPERCELDIERRTLPGEDGSTALGEITSLIADLSKKKRDPDFDATVSVDTALPPFEEDSGATIVKSLRTAGKLTRAKVPRTIGVPYWNPMGPTDAIEFLLDKLKSRSGIPTCLFGPGDIRLAHPRDEYISLDEVSRAAEIFSNLICGFCGVRD